jgi:periplasmic divalent cation tolerance protein
MPPVYLVFTTCPDPEAAERLGRHLVGERLAACATALPGGTSIFFWQGEVKVEPETVLLLKTTGPALAALEARLVELHSYECPEVVAVLADRVSEPYRAWVGGAVVPPIQPV